MNQEHRTYVELTIIGALILSSYQYRIIADVISPESFKNPQLSELYKAIARVGRTKPIDMVTLTRYLADKSDGDQLIALAQRAASMVNSSAHIAYWAFILLELDIADKFTNFINNAKIDPIADTVLYAASREVAQSIILKDGDLLKTIDTAVVYFQQIAPGHHFTESFADYAKNIESKAARIKRMGHLSAFVEELVNIPEHYPPAKQRKIKEITHQLIKELI
jgi:hypothetical protein